MSMSSFATAVPTPEMRGMAMLLARETLTMSGCRRRSQSTMAAPMKPLPPHVSAKTRNGDSTYSPALVVKPADVSRDGAMPMLKSMPSSKARSRCASRSSVT